MQRSASLCRLHARLLILSLGENRLSRFLGTPENYGFGGFGLNLPFSSTSCGARPAWRFLQWEKDSHLRLLSGNLLVTNLPHRADSQNVDRVDVVCLGACFLNGQPE